MENKGCVVNGPLLFKGKNYDYCKKRMMTFFDACHIDMWGIVENGNHILTNKEKNTRYLLNSKARNVLMSILTELEYEKDSLALAYEGTSQVRDYNISMLVHQYELFKMEDNETIDLMFGRFQTIINNLRSLGITYDNYDYIAKILSSFPRR
ncbi:hypothetical protein CR513_10293, partial [Mucuna pruriens]